MLIQKIVNFSKNKKIIFLIGAVLLIALVFLLNLLGQWAISKWGDSLLSEDKKTQMAGGEVKLSGNGSQKSDAFVLKKGLTVFDFEYKGKNGFSAVFSVLKVFIIVCLSNHRHGDELQAQSVPFPPRP